MQAGSAQAQSAGTQSKGPKAPRRARLRRTRNKAQAVRTNTTHTELPTYLDDDNNIQSMSLTDYKDTFIYATLTDMVSSSESALTNGTFTITTSASVSNYTEVSGSNTVIFADTRADTSAYSAAGIPETLDQPTTITNYYLQRRSDASSARENAY